MIHHRHPIEINALRIECDSDNLFFGYNIFRTLQGYGNGALEDIAVSELYYTD